MNMIFSWIKKANLCSEYDFYLGSLHIQLTRNLLLQSILTGGNGPSTGRSPKRGHEIFTSWELDRAFHPIMS